MNKTLRNGILGITAAAYLACAAPAYAVQNGKQATNVKTTPNYSLDEIVDSKVGMVYDKKKMPVLKNRIDSVVQNENGISVKKEAYIEEKNKKTYLITTMSSDGEEFMYTIFENKGNLYFLKAILMDKQRDGKYTTIDSDEKFNVPKKYIKK